MAASCEGHAELEIKLSIDLENNESGITSSLSVVCPKAKRDCPLKHSPYRVDGPTFQTNNCRSIAEAKERGFEKWNFLSNRCAAMLAEFVKLAG